MPLAPALKTIVEVCSSSSISHFAAKRMRVRCLRTVAPSPGSVSSRKSSAPRRHTTSGAITRAFAVSSSASQLSLARTSFETIRCRKSAASGPATRTKARARRAVPEVTVCTRPRLEIVFRSRAERKVADAGYDPARLPPGQYLTEKWPVLHAGSVPDVDLSTWTLRVFGEVEEELELTWEQFGELPRTEHTQDINCVTRWSKFDLRFAGVHPRELLARSRPRPSAGLAIAHGEHALTADMPR